MSSTFCNLHWISCNFIFRTRKTSQGVKSGSWLGAIGSPCCYTEKLTCYESSVRGCIIQLVIDRTTKTPTNIEDHAADLSHLRLWKRWAFATTVGWSPGHIHSPSLVPSDDPRHEGWVNHVILMEILTDFSTEFLLICGQKTMHELCSNAVHVQNTLFRVTHKR